MQRYVRITGQRAAGIFWLRTSMARNLQQSTAVYCSTTIASRGYVLLFVCSCLLAMLERCMPWGRWLRSAPKNGSCTSDTIWYTEQKQQYQGKDCYVRGSSGHAHICTKRTTCGMILYQQNIYVLVSCQVYTKSTRDVLMLRRETENLYVRVLFCEALGQIVDSRLMI